MSIRVSRRSRETANQSDGVAPPVRRSRLNYANVTASLALFAALGGTSYAATKMPAKSVGTIQLKSRAVTNAKIAPRAIDGLTVRDGSLSGADIAPGAIDGSKVRDGSLTGADLVGKVPAAVTADRLASVQRVAVPSANDAATAGSFSIKAASASCPAGTFVAGGGAAVSDQNVQAINDSYPSTTNAWTVNVLNVGQAAPAFTVYAICVPAATGS
jgi:hypothetical protein